MRAYWPYLPIVAIIIVGLILSSILTEARRGVLGYATDMSTSALLSGTNSQRTANGLGSLALNSLLTQAAQNKANDMASRDYWSHNTPDGKTPWTFIAATGYSYQTAGENLAYGFATASDTITGWMNSPGHRANILNTSFTQVGFGVANAASFQGTGPETIVVAMYAQPVAAATPVPTTPVAQTPTSTSQTKAQTVPVTQTAPTATTNQASGTSGGGSESGTQTETQAALPKNATSKSDSAAAANKADSVAPKKISRVQVLSATNVAWSQFAVSMLASLALLTFLLRHSFAWHKVLVRGERFVLHHPWFDVLCLIVMVVGAYLLQTVGTIR